MREDGTFSREDFIYDEVRDIYTCPAGQTLTTTGHVSTDHAIRYFASVPECRAAALSRVLAQGIAGNLCQGALLTRNRTTSLRPVRGDLRCSGVAAACDRQRRCEAAVIL